MRVFIPTIDEDKIMMLFCHNPHKRLWCLRSFWGYLVCDSNQKYWRRGDFIIEEKV